MKRMTGALLLGLAPVVGAAQERLKFPIGVSSKALGYGYLRAAGGSNISSARAWSAKSC